VAEAGTWLYCLVILATLLVEIQGAEGLLKETTTSLAARTKELEVSYAEIDLMYNELSQKQQLAAVGELAAAIAHEVRNPLAIIMNAVSGMRRATITPTDRETLLSIVNEETERLNHLVTELLRFARPVAASRGPASLLDICNRAATEPPAGYVVSVSTPQDEILEPVLVDPGLFRLALDNLVANSVQAMPDGGTIEFAVRRGRFADGTPAAMIDIVDSGCGMTSEELDSARKPFFTTKPRGTGLGIPIADRIVEAHGGEMEIASAPKKGTTVTIRLPFEQALPRPVSYPGAKHPSTRRRLRSIPPTGSVSAPTPSTRPSAQPDETKQ
jgi:signal transduction histidine kinase